MADIIQIRRDTAVNWTAVNPVLAIGELGYETDNKKIKIGDGVTAWNSLAYNNFGSFSGSWNDLLDKPSTFPPESHTHDDRYYTETEVNNALAGKSDTTHNHDGDYAPDIHNHDERYYTETETNSLLSGKADADHGDHGLAVHVAQSDAHPRDTRNEAAFAKNTAFNKNFGSSAGTVCEGDDSRLSDSRPPTAHTHDDRYYTETEVDNALAGKSDATHNHDGDYDPSGAASGEVATHEGTYNHGNIHAPGSDAEDAASIAAIHSGVAADSVADADTFNFVKSVGGLLKKITWSNIKATLKSYFDTLYSAVNHNHDGDYAPDVHNHDSIYEPVFSKNSAFNKNYGSATDSVCRGNDSRLSDNRTPSDNSASYAKIGNDLKGSSAIAASNIDWSAAGVFTKTLTGNTTFTFSNLQLNKVITLVLTGDYVITWPSYMDADHLISGEYDGTKVNYIQIHCTNAGSGTEEVWWSIKTKGA